MPRSATGTLYRAQPVIRFSPNQIRQRRFTPVGLRRRGYARQEVEHFLHLVADDLADARAELSRIREENTRIKTALRQWQAEQARSRAPR
ncbi:MAG TPA: DivIVA domain-containing protein [Micromonospora sp.]|nr:DivIVA domain-containing protein [Micromonospora sp.]